MSSKRTKNGNVLTGVRFGVRVQYTEQRWCMQEALQCTVQKAGVSGVVETTANTMTWWPSEIEYTIVQRVLRVPSCERRGLRETMLLLRRWCLRLVQRRLQFTRDTE